MELTITKEDLKRIPTHVLALLALEKYRQRYYGGAHKTDIINLMEADNEEPESRT